MELIVMWLDLDADGCVFDTVDCYHDCTGCEYAESTSKAGSDIEWIEVPAKQAAIDLIKSQPFYT